MQRIGRTTRKLGLDGVATAFSMSAFAVFLVLIGDALFGPWFSSFMIYGLGPFGHITLGVDRVGAILLMPVFFVSGVVVLAVPDMCEWRFVAGVVAFALMGAGQDIYVATFGILSASWLTVGCAGTEALLLSAIPVCLVRPLLALHVFMHVGGSLDNLLRLLGALIAPLGAARACNAPDLQRYVRATALGLSGIAVGAFTAGMLRVAVGAAVLAALTGAGLTLIANLLRKEIGTDEFDWLGGLARGMPDLSLILLIFIFAVSIVPPGAGFAILLRCWRRIAFDRSGLAMLTYGVGVIAWSALSTFAAIRAFGAISLGRPRSLRAAAAEDTRDLGLLGVLLLAVGALLVGWFVVPGRWSLAVLTLMLTGIVVVLRWAEARVGSDFVPHWTEGFAQPPVWMPFNDPRTEITASGFARPLFGSDKASIGLWSRLWAAIRSVLAL